MLFYRVPIQKTEIRKFLLQSRFLSNNCKVAAFANSSTLSRRERFIELITVIFCYQRLLFCVKSYSILFLIQNKTVLTFTDDYSKLTEVCTRISDI